MQNSIKNNCHKLLYKATGIQIMSSGALESKEDRENHPVQRGNNGISHQNKQLCKHLKGEDAKRLENSRQKVGIVRGYWKEQEARGRSGLNRKQARGENNNPFKVKAMGTLRRCMIMTL